MKNRIYELYALEQLASGSTCIHRLNPLFKLLAAAVFIVTVVSFNRYTLRNLTPYIFYPALLMALSHTPHTMLFKRFLVALPFCLFAGISSIIFDRDTAFVISGLSVSLGVISFFTVLLKTYLCVMAVLILVSVTRFSALTNEMRRLGLPKIFIIMFELTYRYTGVLLSEAYSMNIAYSLRSLSGKGIEMRDMGSFSGQLLIRSFDRAERIYNAMKCRGYALQNIPQKKETPVLQDFIFLFVVCLLCAVFRFVDVTALLSEFLEKFI